MNAIDLSSAASIGKTEASLLKELTGTSLPTSSVEGATPELVSLSKKFKSALKGELAEETPQAPASAVLPSPYQASLSSPSNDSKPTLPETHSASPRHFIDLAHAPTAETASSARPSSSNQQPLTAQQTAQAADSKSLHSGPAPADKGPASSLVLAELASSDTGSPGASAPGSNAFAAEPAKAVSFAYAAKTAPIAGEVTLSTQETEALNSPLLPRQTPEAPVSTSTQVTPKAVAAQPSSLDQVAPLAVEKSLQRTEESDFRQPTARQVVSGSDEQPDDSTLNTLGATVLQSFLSQRSTPVAGTGAPVQTTGTTASAASIEKLQQVITETVSRVLVSDPLHDGNRELRIDFAKDVLPDTSVRLWRDGGRLHVEFTSTVRIADSGLKQGLPLLAESLQQRQPQSALPVVTLNMMNAGDQPGDGRSRQQYQTPYDIEDKA